MRSFRLAFRTFLACASFAILPLVAIADPPYSVSSFAGSGEDPAPDHSAPANPAAAKPKADSAHEAEQKGVIVELTENPQVLKFKSDTVEVDLPKGFILRRRDLDGKLEFSFSGPKNADDTQPGVLCFIVPIGPNDSYETVPSNKAVLEMMLKPGKTNLKNFKEQAGEAIIIDGRAYENATFSGLIADGTALKGFFYVGRVKGGFLIFTGRNGGKYYDGSAPALIGIVKSCKVQDK